MKTTATLLFSLTFILLSGCGSSGSGTTQASSDGPSCATESNLFSYTHSGTTNNAILPAQPKTAQGFTPQQSVYLSSVTIKARHQGGTLKVSVYPDFGGSPSATGKLVGETLTGMGDTAQVRKITFTTHPLLEQGKTYWIVMESDDTDASHWGGYIVDNSTVLTNTTTKSFNGAAWVSGSNTGYFTVAVCDL